MIRWLTNEAAILLLALQFLTRLPVPAARLFTQARLAATPRYYPLIGLLIGCLAALAYWAAAQVFPPLLAALLSTAATLLFTGAFHEDGLADTFDGVGGGVTQQRALEIMKDSRLGTYGAAALVLALGLKAAALAALPLAFVLAALIAAHGLSRASAVLVIATSRYVRFEGKAKPVATGLGWGGLAVTLLSAAAIFAALAGPAHWPPSAILSALAGLALGHVALRLFFEPKLGGYTGDALGAVQQASEIGFYLGLLAWL
ncbi:adenosylcobinamide-GDP ribazoletransferase [Hyphomonas sp. NPDC076900]|uniref:adenosylcobinamide-GDP ribazoletransferase n=1 Tax=unclassified Hyphomonas TaxID=2630699 RepID=UPI003D044179